MASRTKAPIERFHALTEKLPDGCLIWTGYIHKNGYAKHWVDGKNVMAHRWSYEYHVGPIDEGLHIDHLCRNRKCVNPEHLEPVTPAENIRRGVMAEAVRKHWASITHCPKGHPYDEENTYRNGGGRTCWTCKRAARRQHYLDNRQKYIEKAAAWSAANTERSREIGKESQRRYRAKQKEGQ